MGELPEAKADAPTGAARVVRHQFGFAHAAALVCLALLFLPPLTLPRLDTGDSDPLRTVATTILAPEQTPSYDGIPERPMGETTVPPRVSSPDEAKKAPIDPRVDKAFAALNRKNLEQLEAFLAKHREHAYAIAQGYIVQVDAWRKEAEWAAEEAELKKKQSAVELSYD